MSLIRGTDPLALLAIQAGQRPTPTDQEAAKGNNPLDVQQSAHVVGDPVPIVFGRQRNGAGGVFISPKATECRFENDLNNTVTAYYHLVLSEGRIGSLQVRDVFQRQCRVGTFTQTYDRRAGTWEPGNFITDEIFGTIQFSFDPRGTADPTWYDATRVGIEWQYIFEGDQYFLGISEGDVRQLRYEIGVEREKPEATYRCGTIGSYPGISTLSFRTKEPSGSDYWNRQVHCFVRNGMRVYRWADNTANVSSDSFADLAYWLMVNSARIPVQLIDTDSVEATSVFLNANNITTNCWITQAANYSDLLTRWGAYHLIRESSRNGKAGLKPLLPTNSNGTIKTSAITVSYTFTDDLIIPGSEEIVYSDWATRQPFVAQVIWRQQLDSDVGIIRTAEVRYAGTAQDGPYETHDLSQFCTREDHAVKVGAYILAKRVRSTHTMRFKVRPQSHNTIVHQGSIVRVRIERNASGDVPVFHDYLYEVERITKTLAGDIQYDCSHVPVDSQGRSLIALDVANARGEGILLTSNLTGLGCDINSAVDDTVPDEEFTDPPNSPGNGLTMIAGGGGGGGAPVENPDDGLDEYQVGVFFHSAIWIGSTLTVTMRLAPTGRAPRFDLGPLDVTIASTSVVALLPNGVLASPQPETLPTVSFTGQIAAPWDAEDEGAPFPPGDRIFEGQFVIDLGENGAPPIAEDPSEQLTYRAAIEFTEWEGGFTDVAFLNTLNVESTGGQFVVWFDGESARVFPADATTIALVGSEGDYETGEHLGEATFAPPPGVSDVSLFYHSWAVDVPDLLTAADFTIEAWMRPSDVSPASPGDTGTVDVRMVWGEDSGIYLSCFAGWSDIASPGTLAEQHQAYFASQYEGGSMWSALLFGETVQGWKHFSYQRINGEDVFHYHGTRIDLTEGDESLPVIRPVTPEAQLIVYADNQAISGVGLGQVRVSSGALYGTGTFTPPSVAFYDAPGGGGSTFYEVDTIWVIYSAGEIVDDIIEIGPYAGNSGFLVSSDSIRKANGDIIIGPDTIDLFDIWSISTTDPTPP